MEGRLAGLSLGLGGSAGGRLQAGIEALAKHPDGAVQPGRDSGAGDAEQMGRLPGGVSLGHAKVDYLPVGLRQMRDRFPHLDDPPLFLDHLFRARPRSFELDQRNFTAPPALPTWIDFHAGAYGLPDIEGRGAKVGLTALGPAFDPDRGDRTPSAEGLTAARRFAAGRLPALRDAPLLEARVCQYTNTPSGDLLLDRHPGHDNVWLAGGGSGHGFKLGPAVGAYVASRVAGTAPAEDLVGLPAKRPEQERAVL